MNLFLHINITRNSIIQKVTSHFFLNLKCFLVSNFRSISTLFSTNFFNFHSRYLFSIGLLIYLALMVGFHLFRSINLLFISILILLYGTLFPSMVLSSFFNISFLAIKCSFANTYLISIDFFSFCY